MEDIMIDVTVAPGKGKGEIWKKFLRRHWMMAAIIIIAIVVATVGAILVYLWFVSEAQSSGLVPETLDLWTMASVFDFVLNLLFWELLLVGIPLAVAIGAFVLLWWKRLPYDEREEYKRGELFFGKNTRRSDSGNFIWFFVNLGFVVKVWLDGNWDSPFSTWTFDYLVYSYITALVWVLVIVGIPMLIGGTWWLRRELKRA